MTREELNRWLEEHAMELYEDHQFEQLADKLIALGFPVTRTGAA